MIRFGLLGSLELQTAQHRYVPRGPKVRQVLALLLTSPNQVVDIATFAEELWDGAPPRAATTTVRTHVYHLRKMLARESGYPPSADLLVTGAAGYQLRVDPAQLDTHAFTTLVDRGHQAQRAGRAGEAAELLHDALALWRGPVLANVPAGAVLSRYVTHLDELRMRALELRIEADLALGRHRDLVAELRSLVAANPLNEWLQARLIEALHRSGQRSAALGVIRQLRRLLADELGLEPSAEVQRLQQEILTVSGPVPLPRRGFLAVPAPALS